jgi:alkylation response protein AidB-like acyl-CoA dehydrogenase
VDFTWTAAQHAAFESIVAQVSGVGAVDGIADRPYDRKDWLRLGELGLLGPSVPTEFGGAGLGALDTALRIEAFGRGCADTGLVFAANAHSFACAAPLAEYGGDAVKRRLLPGMCAGRLIAGNAMTEAGAGSDVARLATTAEEVPGGYRLTGEKSFVTNGPVADAFVVFATTDPRAGHLGVTAFVVERDAPGLVAGEPFAKMGLASAPAGTVTFDGCFVPDDQVLGAPGLGGAIFQRSMSWERSCLFAGYLGLLDRVLERCVAHVRNRRQFGHRIAEFQSVANRVVDMKLRAESGRLLLYRACWELDRGNGAALEVALAKLAVSEGVLASALDAVRVFGGQGYQREHGIETVLRDAVPATIFSGTSDIQRVLIARELGL